MKKLIPAWLVLFLPLPAMVWGLAFPFPSPDNQNPATSEVKSPKSETLTSHLSPLNYPEGRPYFHVFSNKDGLQQNLIECMAFDKNGYLWVGTEDGAAYYNGRQWTTVNLPNRIVSNEVTAMLAASDGSLWFGGNDRGLSHLQDGQWATFDTKNSGLPGDSVLCLRETTSLLGAPSLWVGTDKGLARFEEGEKAKREKGEKEAGPSVLSPQPSVLGKCSVFTTTNSGLPNNSVGCLLETVSDSGARTLWVGTDTGLARFEEVRRPDSETQSSALSPGVSVLGKCSVFTTKNSGLPSDFIQSLMETVSASGERTLWVGTNGGLACLEEARSPQSATQNASSVLSSEVPVLGKWTAFTTKNSSLPSNWVSSTLESVSVSGIHSIWVGTDGGLVRLEESTVHSPPSTVKGDNSGQALNPQLSFLWTVFTSTNSGLPINGINVLKETVSVSGNRRLWIGTRGGGLAYFEADWWTTLDTQSSKLPNNLVNSFLETVSPSGVPVLWIGTDENGLARYEAGQWTFYDPQTSSFQIKSVTCLLETHSDTGQAMLWAGSKPGFLGCLKAGQWTFYDSKNSGLPAAGIADLLETRTASGNSILWVATSKGLVRYEQGQWTLFDSKNSGLPNDDVGSLAETVSPDGHRILWVGTSGGLARFEEGEKAKREKGEKEAGPSVLSPQPSVLGKWTVFDPTNSSLPNKFVESLLATVTPSGHPVLWVGTYGAGVARLDPNQPSGRWLTLSDMTSPALPDNNIYRVCEDAQKKVYLLTNKGVARLTLRTPTADDPSEYEIYTFTTDDGLPINSCNTRGSMVDSLGRIWVGTVKGAAVFDPAQRIEDHAPKPLVIERTLLGGNQFFTVKKLGDQGYIGPGGNSVAGISLAHIENNLSFEFSLLSYFKESGTRYRTQLVGLDQEPSPWSADHKKEYPTLPEGHYTFKVWGKDYAGNLSGPLEVAFSIRPAPWRTWWAYLAFAVAAALVGYGGVRYRLQALQRRNELLEEKINERTEEISQKNQELDKKVEELAKKNEELARSKEELVKTYQQAERIFSALSDVLPGTVLDDKYRLEEKIGAGGFGAVYRGTHLAMKRKVAIKVFRPASANATVESLDRFKLEAVSTCRVNHPNAVAVLDSGVSGGGIAYLVMELLEGRSLLNELRRVGICSPRRCAEIIIPVCNVLAKAHAAGIVHRDIKPDNVFLHQTDEGEVVKVVDFGIAKLMGESESIEIQSLTGTNNLIGTPTYMSPERLDNKPYDGRADVYSVGIMAYQMLTGHLPFQSDSGVVGLMLQHLLKPPQPLREINPTVPETVESAVMRTLTKNPEWRPTAKEFAQEFAQAIGINLELLGGSGAFSLQGEKTDVFGMTAMNDLTQQPTVSDLAQLPTVSDFTQQPTVSDAQIPTLAGTAPLSPQTKGEGRPTLCFDDPTTGDTLTRESGDTGEIQPPESMSSETS